MEALLSRLAQTSYKDDFVLKGGVLLAAYHLRRPTNDIDMEAVNFQVDASHLRAVVAAVADVSVDDALAIDPARTEVRSIREGDEYSGLRAPSQDICTRLHERPVVSPGHQHRRPDLAGPTHGDCPSHPRWGI
ncbi:MULTISPECIES: nucleotidyl transferase AbiEii/AbiGii toxin family protein [unclassified Cryobacterium]|uniref:nucleotidyl transferase AbiEii/AbiGii toxin family protein n=1 Tax=unclassified Cryobacterium TaxID=2649013 RepID=UPI0018C98AF2